MSIHGSLVLPRTNSVALVNSPLVTLRSRSRQTAWLLRCLCSISLLRERTIWVTISFEASATRQHPARSAIYPATQSKDYLIFLVDSY